MNTAVKNVLNQTDYELKLKSGSQWVPAAEINTVYRTRWGAWAVIGIVWLLSMAAIVWRGAAVEWFVGAVFTLVIAISGIAPMIAARGIKMTRYLSIQQVREGEFIPVQLTMKRSLYVPLVWYAIHDETVNVSSMTRKKVSYQRVVISGTSKNSQISYTLNQLSRGHYQYRQVAVTVGDWLGLTSFSKKIDCEANFFVLPGMPDLESLSLTLEKENQMYHHAAAGSNLRFREAVSRFGDPSFHDLKASVQNAGLGPDSRPYLEGDSLRHIDWRNIARGRGLRTKLFASEQPVPCYIAVDSNTAPYAGDDRLFDACIRFAAAAATKAANLGSDVKLLSGVRAAADASEGAVHQSATLTEMLLELAQLRADGAEEMPPVLARQIESLRGGTLLIFTADWQSGRSWAELAYYAARLGIQLELYFAISSQAPTLAMEEQQKWLTTAGLKVSWVHAPTGKPSLPYAEEGGAIHEYA